MKVPWSLREGVCARLANLWPTAVVEGSYPCPIGNSLATSWRPLSHNHTFSARANDHDVTWSQFPQLFIFAQPCHLKENRGRPCYNHVFVWWGKSSEMGPKCVREIVYFRSEWISKFEVDAETASPWRSVKVSWRGPWRCFFSSFFLDYHQGSE